MDAPDHIDALEGEGELLRRAADRGLLPAVPSCPGWTVGHVVSHVGGFHRNRAGIVGERRQEAPPEWDDLPPDEVTLDWYDAGMAQLLDALRTTEPSTQVWTWFPPDQSVGFWARRAAHETLIHRVDAELAHGPVTPPQPELAVDGIDEVVKIIVGDVPDWGEFSPEEAVVRLSTDDVATTWDVRLGTFSGTSTFSGETYDGFPMMLVVDPVAAPSVAIEGGAGDLDLWLWGRGPIDRLRIIGDVDLAHRLRQICAEGMT